MNQTIYEIDTITVLRSLAKDLDIDSRTVLYLEKRYASEGMPFLTVTLPKLADCFISSLDKGYFSFKEDNLTQFRWKGSALVCFSELTRKVFDTNRSLRTDACPIAVWQLRQLSQYFYKLSLAFTDEQLAQAEDSYLQIEESLSNEPYDAIFVDKVRKNIETFFSFPKAEDVLCDYQPRFGPGTFASNKRAEVPFYRYKVSNDNLCRVPVQYKSISGFLKPYPACPEKIKLIATDTSFTTEVLFVPKDSRGPRVISREPMHSLRFQMAFFDWFSGFLQKNTSNRINFTDQSVNQKLAENGSITGKWATLDLKDASDRISYSLVKALSRHIPVLRFFLRFRSSEAVLPSSKKLKLVKLAGMGSGLTFPWLALIVQASVATGIQASSGMSYSEAQRLVYVYGDDLIVPTTYAQTAKESLEAMSLKLNPKKCFTRIHCPAKPLFRESCGGDFFNGNDVSIVRLKLSNCILDVIDSKIKVAGNAATVQIASHAKELSKAGLLETASYYYDLLEKHNGKLPFITSETSVIGRWTRKYVDYQPDATGTYPLTRVLVPVSVKEYAPEMSPYFNLGHQLRPKELDALGYLDGDTQSTHMDEYIAVPRTVAYKRVKISTFSLVR